MFFLKIYIFTSVKNMYEYFVNNHLQNKKIKLQITVERRLTITVRTIKVNSNFALNVYSNEIFVLVWDEM